MRSWARPWTHFWATSSASTTSRLPKNHANGGSTSPLGLRRSLRLGKMSKLWTHLGANLSGLLSTIHRTIKASLASRCKLPVQMFKYRHNFNRRSQSRKITLRSMSSRVSRDPKSPAFWGTDRSPCFLPRPIWDRFHQVTSIIEGPRPQTTSSPLTSSNLIVSRLVMRSRSVWRDSLINRSSHITPLFKDGIVNLAPKNEQKRIDSPSLNSPRPVSALRWLKFFINGRIWICLIEELRDSKKAIKKNKTS